MAARELLRVFAEMGEKRSEALGVPAHVLRALCATLDYLIAQIPESGETQNINVLKRQALTQLIDILDDETARTAKGAKTQTDLAKVEALQGLVNYLKEELKALQDEPSRRHGRITKIDVD